MKIRVNGVLSYGRHPQSKEDGDPPKLNSDNHHPRVIDGFDITRISSIDPFWPMEEKERSVARLLNDKNKSNHFLVPANPNVESLPMDQPIPSKPTISPEPIVLRRRSPGSTTSVRFGNDASWRDNDEADGSAGLRAIGIG
ncbi:hypothetical protein COLO4_09006 [Corchorus olitorius]|uniref:Uncharacterized protein n=1 Tax=Corchorus olitorius TaxID=93759 RepID=A0A1R3KDS6_9ROSI|nr:hypothetical protein COLO4_09006 [Corchorus olitorius]